jgi:SAM-dependent methyltransferase
MPDPRAPLRRAVGLAQAARRRAARLRWARGLEDLDAHVPQAELGGHAERSAYEPSGYGVLPRALRGERIGPGHVFADYGSGKGKVVLQAAHWPFARVIGVEVAEELTAVARRNAARVAGRRRAGAVELVVADARTWVPPDDLTHAYFFNPFSGEVFEAAIAALVASYDRRPRMLRIIYLHPYMEPALLATGRVRLVRAVRGRRRTPPEWDADRLCVYEVTPPTVAS